MSGIMLQVDASGEISEYKQPYTTIECATEEDFKRLEYLLNLGRATEKAYSKGAFLIYDVVENYDGAIERYNYDETIEELLGWLGFTESED